MPRKRGGADAAAEAETKKAKGGLAVGDDLPEFEVETDEGETVKSTDLIKDNGIVIFFYPKANTPGCTTQACGFRDNYDELLKAGYKVYGMSADKPKSQANWRKKHNFQYNLLSDPSFEALKALGVTKAGGKGINRSHIIIEKGGKIKEVRISVSPKDSVSGAFETITKDTGKAEAIEEELEAQETEEEKKEEQEQQKEQPAKGGAATKPEEPANAAGKQKEDEEEADDDDEGKEEGAEPKGDDNAAAGEEPAAQDDDDDDDDDAAEAQEEDDEADKA